MPTRLPRRLWRRRRGRGRCSSSCHVGGLVMSEVLRGQVSEVRLLKETWGILRVCAGSDDTESVVTGHPLGVFPGDTVEVYGIWVAHPQHGRQFRAKSIRTVVPADVAGAIAWLSSDRFRGIGRKRALAMVEHWGVPQIWQVLEETPEMLAEIAGVTVGLAQEFGEAYRKHAVSREDDVLLRGWGLTDNQIVKVKKAFEEDPRGVVEALKQNPYRLIDIVRGFGFLRADRVAIRMGLPRTAPARLAAALCHILGEAEEQGHCYVPVATLLQAGMKLCCGDASVDAFVPVLDDLLEEGRVVQRGLRIYRRELLEDEDDVIVCVSEWIR